jgi:hypothetical protein
VENGCADKSITNQVIFRGFTSTEPRGRLMERLSDDLKLTTRLGADMTDRATHCGQTQEVFDRPPNVRDAVIDAHGA